MKVIVCTPRRAGTTDSCPGKATKHTTYCHRHRSSCFLTRIALFVGTPTSASGINRVERWFAALTEKQIRRGVHRSTRELEDAIRRFIDHHNARPKPFVWTKTADQILDSVARFCKRTLDSGH